MMQSAQSSPGLYHPSYEHDACGVALIVDIAGRRAHRIVEQGLSALCRLDHRGARGADPDTGDGAGITLQLPDAFFRASVEFELPAAGHYATGLVFLPVPAGERSAAIALIEGLAEDEKTQVLGWREVPTEPTTLGRDARSAMPTIAQLFLAAADEQGVPLSQLALDRRIYRVRKRVERAARERGWLVHFPSLSARTFVYKGMLTPGQLAPFYPDLADSRLASAMALVHSRFSTNTLPSWPLAHPFRYVAHNGEFNTIRGNRNWMTSREALLAPEMISGELSELLPICNPDASDSASFDEVVELLHMAGRSLPHAMLMMIPPAWEARDDFCEARRAFHRFHSCLIEPWDGPACVAFTDGVLAGAVLDRNGLRPARWCRTRDGLVVLSSESGVLDLDPKSIVEKGRLEPGRMFVVDTSLGRIVTDVELTDELAEQHPYRTWLDAGTVELPESQPLAHLPPLDPEDLLRRQHCFGYTYEERKQLLLPMARNAAEPLSSMGTDTPIAVLSHRSRLLFDYFTQQFAQVTNPPLDAIREGLVTSLSCSIGPEGNLLSAGLDNCRRIEVPLPVLDNVEWEQLLAVNASDERPRFVTSRLSGVYPVSEGGEGLRGAVEEICARAQTAVETGVELLVLSDQGSTAELAPIPSLLLTSAVHHHLVRHKDRAKVGLVVQTGDCRTVHHAALLVGFGAAVVNPYLGCDVVTQAAHDGELGALSPGQAAANYARALAYGVLKIMSKMGISTVASYRGAQVFEAIGLNREVIDRYFPHTASGIGGVGLDVLAAEVATRHAAAWHIRRPAGAPRQLEVGGEYQWRREGEVHLFNPETVFLLQHATRTKQYDVFGRYTAAVDDLTRRAGSLRGLFEFRQGLRPPAPLEDVEPIESIVRRFATGAMSYGAISAEAHETLAIAMNRLGGRSNTGEGGEEPDRLADPARRSAVKQIASGRFGVTSEYLVDADEIQIKMAQGAKPGEGGQLPGAKVWPWIARTRHSTPGVGLISPPPHHDIYSIEDLAQLIYDLQSANPAARISVKLVSESGVGTVAVGVAKAHADVVLISGHDGGTGASPMNSIKHAGTPWELGLAETQQTLLLSRLRDRITVQVDGQLKTGRDVVIAALLGAEEFGFATAPLIVSGCVMMRVCHLDTCPVGVATQDPQLRRRFSGRPEFVENFFRFLAEQVREYLAHLGFRSLDEVIGRVDLLDMRPALEHWKAQGLDLTSVLLAPDHTVDHARIRVQPRQSHPATDLDTTLLTVAEPALTSGLSVNATATVCNTDRAVGARLGYEVTARYGGMGLPDDTIDLTLRGTAGQSLGAFTPRGITLRLLGDTNDYVGKGLSGARIILRPDPTAGFAAEDNVIAGNTTLYGATAGELYCRGRAGERFAVRNSGAVAVVEGIGDHGCEYMTGGTVIVLGPIGRNFAAGMSGGVAYGYHLNVDRVNRELVEMTPLSGPDVEVVHTWLSRHAHETESELACRILAEWETSQRQFTRVMPREYLKMTSVIADAQANGRDADAAVMAVMQHA